MICRAGDRIQCLGAAAAVLAALATRPDWHRTRVVFLNGRAKASMAREVLGLLEVQVEPAGRASGVGVSKTPIMDTPTTAINSQNQYCYGVTQGKSP